MLISKGPRRATHFTHGDEQYAVRPPTATDPIGYDIVRNRDNTVVGRFLLISGDWFPESVRLPWAEISELWHSWMGQAPIAHFDVLAQRAGEQVVGRYLVVHADSGDTSSLAFQLALDVAREGPIVLPDLLEIVMRQRDLPGEPVICAWTRKGVGDSWLFRWADNAAGSDAAPLSLDFE